MKHMRLLVLKDFQVQLKSMMYFFAIGLIFMLVFTLMGSGSQTAFPMSAFVIIYGLINRSLYEDEKNNTLRLLVSLPLKRDNIVIAKYLSMLLTVVAAGAAMGFLNVLLAGILPAADAPAGTDIPQAVAYELIVICIALIFLILMSVYLPLAFKLGYIRAVNINRFVFLGVFALFGALPALLKKIMGDNPERSFTWMEQVKSFIESLNPGWLIALFILFSACIYLISMCISIRFFRKRQLF